MKIKNLIITILVLSVLINSAIIVGFTTTKIKTISDTTSQTSSEQLMNNAGKSLLDVSIGLRNSLDNQLQNEYTLVKTWAKTPTLLNTAKEAQTKTKEELYEMWSAQSTRIYDEGEATGDGNPNNDLNPEASNFLIALSAQTAVFPELFITDNRGYAIAANVATGDFDQGPDDWRVFLDEAGKPYFKMHKPGINQEAWYYATNQAPDGFYVSDVIYDESSGTWGLEMISQLKDQSTGVYLGQLKAVFDYSAFVNNFVNLKDLNVETVQVVTKNGEIIANSKNTNTGITELRKVSQTFADELKKGQESGVFKETDSQGNQLITAYVRSKDKNQHIVAVSKKYTEINAPIESFVTNLKANIDNQGKALTSSIILMALIIGLITLIAGTILVTKRVSQPLQKLTDVSEKLGKGEINGLEVDVSGNDEIGKLGEGFKGVLAAFNLLHDEVAQKNKVETKKTKK